MSQLRTAARCDGSFAGGPTSSSENNVTVADIMHHAAHSQQPFPNYCRHLPAYPEFFKIPVNHKPRAKIIQEAIERLKSAYFKPKKNLTTLQVHVETTGNQVKSQRRNAAIAILQVMLYYLDDATGRVGRRLESGGYNDLSISKLASYAGLRLKRAKRALAHIIKAGYIRVTRQYIRAENGDIFAKPSIREVTPKLFIELDVKGDLWTKWFSNKIWKKEQLEKKGSKVDKRKARAMMGLISEGLKGAKKKAKSGFDNILDKTRKIVNPEKSNVELEKRLIHKALECFNLDPSKTVSEYYRELSNDYHRKG